MVFLIGIVVGAMAGVIGVIVTALCLSERRGEESDEQNM